MAAFVFRGTGVETSPALKLNTRYLVTGWWAICNFTLEDASPTITMYVHYLLPGVGVGGLNLAEVTFLFLAGSDVSA